MILIENCNYNVSKDPKLPKNTYIITYQFDDCLMHDIVQSNSRTKIFDTYYDRIGNGIESINWTNGRSNSKTYGAEPEKSDNRRKK